MAVWHGGSVEPDQAGEAAGNTVASVGVETLAIAEGTKVGAGDTAHAERGQALLDRARAAEGLGQLKVARATVEAAMQLIPADQATQVVGRTAVVPLVAGTDVGRSLWDITHRLDYPGLAADAISKLRAQLREQAIARGYG